MKNVDYRCYIVGIDKKDAINLLNNSVLNNKGVLNFGINKTPVEIIKEGSFGGTYFRYIYSGVNDRWYRNARKEFKEIKNIDKKFYSSDYYNVSLNKYGVKCGTHLRFWEDKGWINEIGPYGRFQWYFRYLLGRRSKDDQRQTKRWKGIVNRFKGILIKMIKGADSEFDYYSISPKIRQISLRWGYELTKDDVN